MSEEESRASRLEAIATRWSQLRDARDGTTGAAAAAREALVLRYQPAIRRYVGVLLKSDADAEDLTQDVMVRLLAGDFAGADPQRGRFRNLLKTALRNMVRNHWARQKRRRGVDFDVAEVSTEDDAEDAQWLAAWRRHVLDLAWNALKQRERSRQGNLDYTLMRLRTEHPADQSEQLAARLSEKLGKPVRADTARQKLRRARIQFVDLLITEIGNGMSDPTPEKIEDELADLGLLDFVSDLLPEQMRGTG